MTLNRKTIRKPIRVPVGEDFEALQDSIEQDDILTNRDLKQDVAEIRRSPSGKRTLSPDKIRLIKDISVARKALKKGKILPPVGGR